MSDKELYVDCLWIKQNQNIFTINSSLSYFSSKFTKHLMLPAFSTDCWQNKTSSWALGNINKTNSFLTT